MAERASLQPASSGGRLVSFLPAAVAATILAATAWGLRGTPPVLPLDDAYITLHTARALLAGGDRQYGSPLLAGITSAPHLLLVTATQALAPGEASVLGLAWVGLALYAGGLVQLARRAAIGPAWSPVLVGSALTAGKLLPFHALNGLETSWALAALTWALTLAWPAAAPPPRPIALGLLLGTMPFLRPELGAVSLALLAVSAHAAWREGAPARRRFLILAGAAALAALPWLAWYLVSTGAPLPSTALVKAWFRGERCLAAPARLAELRGGLAESLPGAVVLGTAFLGLEGVGIAGAAGLVAFFGVAFALFPFAPQMQEGRYTVVFVPILVLGFACGLRAPRAALRRLAAALLTAATVYDLARLPEAFAVTREARAFTASELAATATWLERNLPGRARLLVHDAGYVAWATPFALVDAVGLKTPASAATHRRETWPSCGDRRGDALAAIAAGGGVTHLVALADWEARYGFARALRAHAWTVALLRDGHTGYSVYELTPPSALGDRAAPRQAPLATVGGGGRPRAALRAGRED